MLTVILMTKDVINVEKLSDPNLGINKGIKVDMKNGRTFKFSAFSDRDVIIEKIKQFNVKASLKMAKIEEELHKARPDVEQEYLSKIQSDPLYIRYPPSNQGVSDKIKRRWLRLFHEVSNIR
jgi:hypothetical protein